MSLSEIIRHTRVAPTVFIGEKQYDAESEVKAERKLARLFPRVEYVTVATGAKLIPILEVDRLEQVLVAERETARQAGYEQGRQAGYATGQAEARRVLQQLEQAIGDAVGAREILLEEAKQKVFDLVLRISRKVTCDAIDIDREKTAAMIARIIDGLTDRSRLRVLVHPDFVPIVEQNINRYLTGPALIKELTIEGDPRIKMGGCFIQTPSGDIDARLESQFEIITDVMESSEGAS
jgi:flagellar biosynthesis/type III secretory pathway protein FliH